MILTNDGLMYPEELVNKFTNLTGTNFLDKRMIAFLFLSFLQNTGRRTPFMQNEDNTPETMNNLDIMIYLVENALPRNFTNLEICFSDNETEWIENSKRQRRWITSHLETNRNFKDTNSIVLYPENIISGLSPKDLMLLTLNVIATHNRHIKVIAQNYEEKWNDFDKSPPFLTWFEGDTKGKIECLTKRYTEQYDNDYAIKNLEDIAILFDEFELNNQKYELKILFDSTKTLYQKRTFTTKHKDKAQCNVMLPIDLLVKLKKQATNRGVTRSQLIQKILIQAINDKEILNQLLANDFTIRKPNED